MSAGSLDTALRSRATSFSSRARSRSARSRSILARAAACSLASRRAASDADRAAALRASARNRSTVDASTLLLDASSAKVSQASRKPRAGAATVAAGVACRAFILSFRARLWCCSRVDGVCGSVSTRSRLVFDACCGVALFPIRQLCYDAIAKVLPVRVRQQRLCTTNTGCLNPRCAIVISSPLASSS